LLRRCASEATALGEPLTAAQGLLRIPIERLDLSDRALVLSELAEYSKAASEFTLASQALTSLLQTAREMRSSRDELCEIEFRLMEADLQHGADPTPIIRQILALVQDGRTPSLLRVRAGGILLIAADMALDEELAKSTFASIASDLTRCGLDNAASQRARLVFHTVFGDRAEALATVNALLDRYPIPHIGQVALRRNIGYALLRLGLLEMAKSVVLADYEFMMSRHVPSEATYRMILLGEIALYEGNFEEARIWVSRLGQIVAPDTTQASAIRAGYYSAAAELALRDGRFDEAGALVDQAYRIYPAISSPRYLAIALSIRLRVRLGRGCDPTEDLTADIVHTLRALYERGKHLSAQDEVVEALWLADSMAGREGAASRLLLEYLTVYRREAGPVHWPLRTTTRLDPAWEMITPAMSLQ
jgi:tetratricopeptide (TPR) repeat protein